MRVAIVDATASYKTLLDYLQSNGLISELINMRDEHDMRECDIVLTSSAEWNSRSAVLIARAKRSGLPTLHIVDGVLKWGTTWSSMESDIKSNLPEFSGLPQYQPALSHKIGCLGPAQARILSSWGQFDKVEVTGNPRMDAYVDYRLKRLNRLGIKQSPRGKPARLLILVANRPAYTEPGMVRARQSYLDLNEFLKQAVDNYNLSITWRGGPRSPDVMPEGMVGSIDQGKCGLIEALENADFVISSPSTAILEAMSMEIPTCILDYSGSPELLHAAWVIRSKEFIAEELESLFTTDVRRMQLQRYLVHDQIRIDSSSSARISQLMLDMILIAKRSRSAGIDLTFPASMVPGHDYSSQMPYHYAPETLFESHPLFSLSEVAELNRELADLHHYCSLLEHRVEAHNRLYPLGLAIKSRLKLALSSLLHSHRIPRPKSKDS